MGWYKVRPGHVIGQNGRTFAAGAVVEIPDPVAADRGVRAHVDPCDAQGVLTPAALAPDFAGFAAALATAKAHERVSLAEAEVARRRALLTEAETRLAAERAAAAPAAAPAPPATETTAPSPADPAPPGSETTAPSPGH